MVARIFEREERLPVDAAAAFAWHERDGALERLTPPWERVRLISRTGEGIKPGARVSLQTRAGPCWLNWVAEHREYAAGKSFRDEAVSGPFARWDHRHEFIDDDAGNGCRLRDRIDYTLPGGWPGDWLARRWVEKKLSALFAYRQTTTRDDLAFARDHAGAPSLCVWVTGASGLVGRALVPFLRTQGLTVLRLVRGEARAADELAWNPQIGRVREPAERRLPDAVVHLAGAGIADGRWTSARRREIRESRVQSTAALARFLAELPRPPQVIVGASAIGYYGDTGATWVDETSAAGRGFLAEVTSAWEAAWTPAEASGVRVVRLRTGMVLSSAGGALGRMLPVFRVGAGGRLGRGEQWVSWISIDDLVGAIAHALVTPELRGAMNAVAPNPVTNREFTRVLAGVLRRPAILRAPAWGLRAALGRGLADEVLLAGQRVWPGVLLGSEYRYRHENLEAALRHVLGHVC